jgi:putative transposase
MLELIRTERIELKPNKEISKLCHQAKNLYNSANYIIRQHYFSKKAIPTYFKLCKLLQKTPEYKILPSHTAQQILRNLSFNWTSFIKAKKEFKTNSKKFLGKPRIPNYKKTNGEKTVYFTSNQVYIKKKWFY